MNAVRIEGEAGICGLAKWIIYPVDPFLSPGRWTTWEKAATMAGIGVVMSSGENQAEQDAAIR